MVSLTTHDLKAKHLARYAKSLLEYTFQENVCIDVYFMMARSAQSLLHYTFENSWVPIGKLSLLVRTCSTSVLTNSRYYIAELLAVTSPYAPLLPSSLSSPFDPRTVTQFFITNCIQPTKFQHHIFAIRSLKPEIVNVIVNHVMTGASRRWLN